ncbi:MAG: C40 family peptidase [Lachnospiraceae bacterium]|nr:C40 family peptidase [Lachnospiraceae bacterium]
MRGQDGKMEKDELLKKRIIRGAAGIAVIVLTGVNTAFGAINIHAARSAPHVEEETSNAESEETTTAPTQVERLSEEVPETTEEETVETTPAPDAYELDDRYAVVKEFGDQFGFIYFSGISVEIYEEPNSESRVIGRAMCYSGVDIISATEFFYRIGSEGCTGYVLKQFVTTGEEAKALALEYAHSFAYVAKEGTPILKEPEDNAEAVFYPSDERLLAVVSRTGNWAKVKTENGTTGYVRENDLDFFYTLDKSYFFQKPGEKISDERLDILNYAFKWFGTPYVWGGETLGQGVDCSAYVWRVFQKFNIAMPRLSAEQAEWGTKVASMDEALPGDLLFYHGFNDAVQEATEGVGHVGIYIGNGRMIHAASVGRGIVVDDYDYVEKPLRIRRVIDDSKKE